MKIEHEQSRVQSPVSRVLRLGCAVLFGLWTLDSGLWTAFGAVTIPSGPGIRGIAAGANITIVTNSPGKLTISTAGGASSYTNWILDSDGAGTNTTFYGPLSVADSVQATNTLKTNTFAGKIVGDGGIATGAGGAAFGLRNQAGAYTITAGAANNARGQGLIVGGIGNTVEASAPYSIVAGRTNDVQGAAGNNLVIGANNHVDGVNSAAIGSGIEFESSASFDVAHGSIGMGRNIYFSENCSNSFAWSSGQSLLTVVRSNAFHANSPVGFYFTGGGALYGDGSGLTGITGVAGDGFGLTNLNANSVSNNVKFWGATGDGTTDDTLAVQAGLDRSRNSLYFPSGTYLVTNLSITQDGMRLFGDGPTSILQFKTGSTNVLLSVGANRIDLSDLNFYGGDDTSKRLVATSPTNRSGISLDCQTNSTITRVTVHGFGKDGIFFSNPLVTSARLSNLRISDSEIYNNWRGLQIGNTTNMAEYTKFSDLSIYQNYLGMQISAGNTITVNTRVNDNGWGVSVLGASLLNEAHGSFIGGQINHNIVAILADNVAAGLGFVFDGVNIFEGSIVFTNSTGIQILNGIFDLTFLYFSGGGPNVIKNNYVPNSYGNVIYHNYALSADQTVLVGNYFSDGTYLDSNYNPTSDGGLTYSRGQLTMSLPTSQYGSDAIPTMTSDSAPSGTVNYSTQNAAAQYNGFHAFDHASHSASGWAPADAASMPQWLSYQFAATKIIGSYKVSSVPTLATWAPKDWTFEGSNNGSSWTVLDGQTNQTSWTAGGQTRTFVIATTNLAPYAYYRINVSAFNGGTLLAIAELQMVEVYPQYVLKDDNASSNQKLWGLQSSRSAFSVNSITDAGVVSPVVSVSSVGNVQANTITLTNNPTFNTTNAAPAGFVIGVTVPVVWFAVTNAGNKYLIPGFSP